MPSTETLAIIGAVTGIIGTIAGLAALGWDIYKWKHSGPRLRMSVSPNMKLAPPRPGMIDNRMFLMVRVVNEGQAKTTITHLAIVSYKSKQNERKNLSELQGVITNPIVSKIPHVLEPGEEWGGLIERTPEILDRAINERLFVQVYHSLGKKPVTERVIIPDYVLKELGEQKIK